MVGMAEGAVKVLARSKQRKKLCDTPNPTNLI